MFEHHHADVPTPPSELRSWLLAGVLGALGAGVLLAVLLGAFSSASPVSRSAPPALVLVETTPRAPATSRDASAAAHAAIVAQPSPSQQREDAARFEFATQSPIPRSWMEGFYAIYATAERTFGVNWLLVASIHRQETAFSTARGTYHGLNFARCCGGPMQFNVRNGPVTTWQLVSNSYIYGRRPRYYDHRTSLHPSIYDDFDSIMAAAHLLSADGAEYPLDFSAWYAAYDYYGHDSTGVTYADQVLARAIGWSQRGFCINCGIETRLLAAVHAAYGARVHAALEQEERARAPASSTPRSRRPRASARRRRGRSRRQSRRAAGG